MGLFSYFLNKNQATELEDTIVACWNKIQNYKKSNIEGDITYVRNSEVKITFNHQTFHRDT